MSNEENLDLVAVHSTADFLEADAIRQALTAEGIPCHLEGEHSANLFGSSLGTLLSGMRLLVRQCHVEKAKTIIETYITG